MRGEQSYERISDKRQWKIVEEIKRTLNEVASELQRHAKNGVNMKLSTATGNTITLSIFLNASSGMTKSE